MLSVKRQCGAGLALQLPGIVESGFGRRVREIAGTWPLVVVGVGHAVLLRLQ